jgi:DNA-3-methyladenine glycosylase
MDTPRRLSVRDYQHDAVTLAPALLGKTLCRRRGENLTRLRITETEAYYGEADTACHACKGRTARTSVMYLPGGHAYVYLCYGIHWMLNIVSGPADHPEAVLIRGVEGYNGPGKLTRALGIGGALNSENLIESENLWIEDDGRRPVYRALTRVGIDYAAEEDRNRLWRFVSAAPENAG